MRRVRGQRLAAVVATLAAAGALPGAAAAKELSAVTACGAGACRTAHDAVAAAAIADDAMRTGPPAVAGDHYAVTLHVTHDGEELGSSTVRWFPSAGTIRRTGDDGRARWYEPSAAGLAALRALARGLRPLAPGDTAARPPSSTPMTGEGGHSTAWLTFGAAALALLLAGAARRRRTGRPDAPPA